MKREFIEEVEKLGGDIASPEWQWFLTRGPHGESFTWSQTRNEPPGYVGFEHLKETIDQYKSDDSSFKSRITDVVVKAIKSENTEILRRAIQVASLIGGKNIQNLVKELINHCDSRVSGDARACVFVLERQCK